MELRQAVKTFDAERGLVGETPVSVSPEFWQAIEAREVMEGLLARLAALRRTDADLARLDAALAQMQSAGDDIDAFNSGDFAFHVVLARAAHNDYLATRLAALHGWVRGMISLYTEIAFREGQMDVLLDSHERLAGAVARGDGDAATLLIGEMMERLREHAVALVGPGRSEASG
jgi:GntR family transcriptional repressor for pyruvate dehydrogenase complex